MKLKSIIAFLAIPSLLFFSACSKSNEKADLPVEDPTTVTPVGTPLGQPTIKTIGATGGQISSPDGRILVTIPAGALEANREISVQAITNELPDGIGTAYRLLPHGEVFQKPVTITFNYKPEDLKSTLPEFLDIAYQDETGSWQAIAETELNKTTKKVSVTTTHFSDWTFFKSLIMEPYEATVALGGELTIKVITHFPYVDPDDAPPGQPTIKLLKNPRPLRPHEMEGWSYAGDGILVSRVNEAYYTAPDEEPEANPEAVTANIHLARKGKFMLICNITVVAGSNVKYLRVDENYRSPLNNGDCMLYIWGEFGNDPGASKRSVKINGTEVPVNIWNPKMLRCNIDREIFGAIEISANNKVIASSVLRRFSGTIVYERFQGGKSNAGSTNPLKETAEFKIVYRGFGEPAPADIEPVFNFPGIGAFGTRVDYTIRGSAAVTTPGTCPTTTSVTIPETSGIMLMNTISQSIGSRFLCTITEITDGISIGIDYVVESVVTGIRVQRSNCNYTSLDPARSISLNLEGFSNEQIELAFSGTEGLTIPQPGGIKSHNFSSSILIEAWDGTGNPSHYQTDGLMPATFKNKQ